MSIESTNKAERGDVKRWKGHKIVGVFLSVMGFLWLSKKLGWMSIEHSHTAIFWPLVVIAFGLLMIFGFGGRGKKHSE